MLWSAAYIAMFEFSNVSEELTCPMITPKIPTLIEKIAVSMTTTNNRITPSVS